MSSNLLESLWSRIDTRIGSRITQISELLTQALSANTESTSARDIAVAAEQTASTAATNAASSESVAKSAETAASGHAQVAQTSATEAVDAKNRAVEIVGGDFATLDYVDQRVPVRGTGSPEGKVAAPVGTAYLDSAATNGAIRWVKTSGTGTSGWRVEYGNTGWRSINDLALPTWEGRVKISRSSNVVNIIGANLRPQQTGETVLLEIPAGFRPSGDYVYGTGAESGTITHARASIFSPYNLSVNASKVGSWLSFSITYYTADAWPTSLPGTPT